ncbi:MAG: NCS2 family permease [Lachnospira sp.]|nr:NCS2 family permease [Lachnospira sp.]
MEKYFKVKEHGSTVKVEILAGITTFMAMAYILMVNAGMFSALPEVSYNAIYIATALSAVAGTFAMAFLANLSLGLASGMGLNAFFVYTACFNFGLSYANALVLVLLDGIVFIILTLTGIRTKLFTAIPDAVRKAISAGIGLFIAFLGLQNAGIIVNDESTLVNLSSFNILNGNASWTDIMPKFVTIMALVIIAVLTVRKIKGSVLWGILGGSIIYYVLGFTVPGFYDGFFDGMTLNPFAAFGDWASESFGKVFTEGFNFSGYLADHSSADLVLVIATTALAFCMVDMFDTLGTLYGACSRGDLLDKDGQVPNFEKAMLSDAIATCVGAICGTSTVTTFVESTSGVAEGGRTGLSAFTTGCLFFVAMFLSPIAALIPGCATAAALIYVGVLMMGGVTKIDWNDISVAVPSFLTIAFMAFTYNISYGIAFGMISYIFIMLFTGRAKEIKAFAWLIAVLFTLMFFLTH